MSLKAKVKVGHVTNLSEARYCAGMGVDLLGFPVGENGLRPEQYKQLIEWVVGPEFILEVHQSQAMDIRHITDNYPGHYIEVGTRQLDWLDNDELNFIVAVTSAELRNVEALLRQRKNVKFVEVLDWNGESVVTGDIPLLLNTNNVNAVLPLNAGIALNGSDEDKPGIKDYSEIAEVLEALEE